MKKRSTLILKVISSVVAFTFLTLQLGLAADTQLTPAQGPQQIEQGLTPSHLSNLNQQAQDRVAQANVLLTLANGTTWKPNQAGEMELVDSEGKAITDEYNPPVASFEAPDTTLSLKNNSPYEVDLSIGSDSSTFKMSFQGMTQETQYVTKTIRTGWFRLRRKRVTVPVNTTKSHQIEISQEGKDLLLKVDGVTKRVFTNLTPDIVYTLKLQEINNLLGLSIYEKASQQLIGDVRIGKYNSYSKEVSFSATGDTKFGKATLPTANFQYDDVSKTTTVTRDGLIRRYDEKGALVYAKLDNGVEVFYEKGVAKKVITKDASGASVVVTNPILDNSGKVTGGEFNYADGLRRTYKDGQILKQVLPDGAEAYYEKDKLKTLKRSDGSIRFYSYETSPSKREVMIEENPITGAVNKYMDGKLMYKKDLEGNIEEYSYGPDNRLSSSIKTPINGKRSTYTYTYQGDQTFIRDDKGLISVYDKDDKLISQIDKDGVVTEFIYDSGKAEATGAIVKDKDGGYLNTLTYKKDKHGRKLVEDDSGTSRIYDDEGELLYVETPEGIGYTQNQGPIKEETLAYIRLDDGAVLNYENGKIDSIEFADGRRATDLKFSPDNRLLKATIILKDGSVQVYEDGSVAEGVASFVTQRFGDEVKTYDQKGRLIHYYDGKANDVTYSYHDSPKGLVKQVVTNYKTIGGYLPPVKLKLNADSHGFEVGNRAEIYVNDVLIKAPSPTWNSRGYNIAVLDEVTGAVLDMRNFDTWNRSGEYQIPTNGDKHLIDRKTTPAVDNMISFLNSIPNGRIVVVAVSDEGSDHMTKQAYDALASIGSAKAVQQGEISDPYAGTRVIKFRESWTIIGRKGLSPGQAIESYSSRGSGPALISSYTQTTRYIKLADDVSSSQNLFPAIEWQSRRPAKSSEVTEVLAYNQQGDASSWIKRLNAERPESGFIRLWDGVGGFNSDAHMETILELSASKTKKAVYFDLTYPTSWTWEYSARYYANYLRAEGGFEVLDAQGLKQFMEKYGDDSIVVMAQDVFPDTVLDRASQNPLVKDYLTRGGSVIWKQDTPFYYIGHKGGNKEEWGIEGQNKMLGVGEGRINVKDAVSFISPQIYNLNDVAHKPDFILPTSGENAQEAAPSSVDLFGELERYIANLKIDTDITSAIEYDKDGNTLSIEKLDGTSTVYDKGKVLFITDEKGNTTTTYNYDSDGQLVSVQLNEARKNFDREITRSKDEIAQAKVESLLELAYQAPIAREAAISRITEEVENSITNLRYNIDAQRTRLIQAINDLEGQKAHGKEQKKWKSQELDRMRRDLDLLNAREAEGLNAIYNQRASAYAQADAQLKAEVERMTAQIEADEKYTSQKLEAERNNLERELLKQEFAPVIVNWFRVILGRDPNEAEVKAKVEEALSKGALDVESLKTELKSQAEYSLRKTQKENIINGVQGFLDNYLRAPPAPPTAGPAAQNDLVTSLGLSPSDIKTITQSDLEVILTYLKSQNLHFGSSAFLALQNFLNSQLQTLNSQLNYEELSTKALLIDILTGVLTKTTKGELVISLYALKKTAESYGATASAAKLTTEELVSQLQTPNSKLIAHINGNHYVTVTKVEDGKIYYFEPNAGANGEEHSLTIDEFKDVFGGYVLLKDKPADERKLISNTQAKSVKGAFWPFIAMIITTIVTSAVAVITTIATAIAGIIAGITSAIAIALKGIILAVSSIVSGIGSALTVLAKGLFAGISFVGTSLFKGLVAIGAKLFAGGFFQSAFNNTLIQGGLNYLIAKGLRAIGLSDSASNIAAAFITGAIIGLINPAAGAATILNSAITTGARFALMQGITELGKSVGLDGPLVSILSIAGGSLVGGSADFNKVFSTISGELAYYGIIKLGQLIGIDPRINQLLGMPVRTSVTGSVNGNSPDEINKAITQGLLQGVTSVVVEAAGQAAGLGPLATSLTARALTGAIEGALGGGDIFKGISNAIANSTDNLLNNQGDPSDPTRIAKVLELSQIIKERGLEAALTDYASAIFHRDTVDAIWSKGGIADFISGNAEVVTNEKKGMKVKRVYTNKEKTDYFDLSLENGDIVAIKQGNVYENCKFVIGPDKKPLLKDGTRYITNPDGSTTVLTVSDYKLVYIENISADGKTTSYVIREEGTDRILLDEDNNVLHGKKINLSDGYEITMHGGEIAQMISNFGSQLTEDDINLLAQKFNMAPEDLKDIRLIYKKKDDGTFSTTIESGGMYKFSQGLAGYVNKFNEFMGISNYAPQVEVDPKTGVSKVDMPLEYYHLWGEFNESLMANAEIYSLLLGRNAANEIWSKATTVAAPFIVDQLASGSGFVYIPGANGSGPTMEELNLMNSMIGDTRQIAFAHSAGPDALLKAAVLAKQQGVDLSNTKFIFASPRMSAQVFEYYVKEAGLKPDQVLVVTSKGDIPHWPGASLSVADLVTNPLQPYRNVINIGMDMAKDGYEGNKNWTYAYLETDITYENDKINNDKILDHSSMINGLLQGHIYDVRVNGNLQENRSLADIYKNYPKREDNK